MRLFIASCSNCIVTNQERGFLATRWTPPTDKFVRYDASFPDPLAQRRAPTLEPLPYQIAALCYLFDRDGRLLLLHRHKHPNRHLYSPVGGKLETSVGESPAQCAAREIKEETGLDIPLRQLHLTGIISESAYKNESHWLMFLFEAIEPVQLEAHTFDEGRLEWIDPDRLNDLPIPDTDRHIIWPMFWRFRRRFFTAHIDCTSETLRWRLEQPADEATEYQAVALDVE